MWRIRAIEEAGGWQHDTLTEDTDLSYRCQLKGWKFLYLQDVECPAELPIEMTAFKTQQVRWAKGLIQCAIKDLPQLMRSKVSRREKVEAWYHLTANLSYPLMIMLSVLLLPAMIIRFYQGWFQMMYIDVPLFLASTFSISSFYLVSQKELFPYAMVANILLLAFPDGAGNWIDDYQLQGCDRGVDGETIGICAHPEVQRTEDGREEALQAAQKIPQAPGRDSMDRTGGRLLLCDDGVVRHCE